MTSTLSYESILADRSIETRRDTNGTRVSQGGSSVTAETYGQLHGSTVIDLKSSGIDVSDSPIATSLDDSYADKNCSLLALPDQEILEYFVGKVEQVVDGIAFVSLTSPAGEKLMGQYSASELKMKDIHDGDWFDCETVDEKDHVSVRITKRKRIPLSDQMLRRMDEELDFDFAGLE